MEIRDLRPRTLFEARMSVSTLLGADFFVKHYRLGSWLRNTLVGRPASPDSFRRA
jgi:hypothetical protein